MDIADPRILTAYGNLRSGMQEKQRLPAIHVGSCRVQSTRFNDPELLWAKLAARHPSQGWLQFQSRQQAFFAGLPERDDAWGLLLAAEAVDSTGDSLAIAQDGRGGWVFSHFVHAPDLPGLWDKVKHCAHDPKIGTLHYRRYWRHHSDQGYVQERACFIGFE